MVKLIVLANARPGRELDYETWYREQHIPDVLRIPGFLSGRQYVISAQQRAGVPPPPYRYYAEYELDPATVPETLATLQDWRGTARMPLTDSLAEGSMVYLFEPLPGPDA